MSEQNDTEWAFILDRLRAAANTPLIGWREAFPDHLPLGMYNAYVPVEIFLAAGLTPVYIFHRSDSSGFAGRHLPAFTCWPGRSLIDQATAGNLDSLAGLALGQSCDVVQALVDIWRQVMPGVPLYHIGMPVHLAGPAARSYLVTEFNLLREALGGPSDDALQSAIAVYNETRRLIQVLYDRVVDLLPTDLYLTLRAAMVMPPDEFNPLLARLLETLPDLERSGPRVILIGPHLADPTIFQVIQDAGAMVVDDLLDLGHRYLTGEVSEEGDPIVRLAERYLGAPPTPTKYHPLRGREQVLNEYLDGKLVDGVIFVRQKFCDPHGFDYARLDTVLSDRHMPHLLIDLEQTPQVGQLQTRVEAFVEMLHT